MLKFVGETMIMTHFYNFFISRYIFWNDGLNIFFFIIIKINVSRHLVATDMGSVVHLITNTFVYI